MSRPIRVGATELGSKMVAARFRAVPVRDRGIMPLPYRESEVMARKSQWGQNFSLTEICTQDVLEPNFNVAKEAMMGAVAHTQRHHGAGDADRHRTRIAW
jgi:hypothetical protein